MRFHVVQQHGLSNGQSPFRVVGQSGREVDWINRFLDQASPWRGRLDAAHLCSRSAALSPLVGECASDFQHH